ncbi:unnamed protein product, partial [Mesorhabditis spiculigera]
MVHSHVMARLVLLLSIFLLSALAQDCSQPPDRGQRCPENQPKQKFAYDTAKGKCVPLYYLGCQGNDNQFLTFAECQKACQNSDMTTAPNTNSTDNIAMTCGLATGAKLLYNADKCESSKCATGYECKNEYCCPTKETICSFDPESGREEVSGKHFGRYAYMPGLKNCIRFSYFGVGGNLNNFLSYKGCVDFYVIVMVLTRSYSSEWRKSPEEIISHHYRLLTNIRPVVDTSAPVSMYNSPKSVHYIPKRASSADAYARGRVLPPGYGRSPEEMLTKKPPKPPRRRSSIFHEQMAEKELLFKDLVYNDIITRGVYTDRIIEDAVDGVSAQFADEMDMAEIRQLRENIFHEFGVKLSIGKHSNERASATKTGVAFTGLDTEGIEASSARSLASRLDKEKLGSDGDSLPSLHSDTTYSSEERSENKSSSSNLFCGIVKQF